MGIEKSYLLDAEPHGMQLRMHIDSWNDEVFYETTQSRAAVEAILDTNKAHQNMGQRRSNMRKVASVPMFVWELWQDEYRRGPASKNVEWSTFLKMKLNSREFKYFKTIHGEI